ncbi:RsfA family transcriptional regulator [Paraliobacillus ryukyuensis]|uniref:RsfA family transcriptional regulator n=1 Tax=Paraliobacillus ryukyuensis TaxID=200904 RepID=UPI0009A8A60D|nr:RsfA family transcriptional regulator [Paraliobacillus ryukyuensis]
MAKVRQDAWSHEDDLLLAETVLRHIREGSTQLNAFEEVGDKLNRTSAACGFRWNAEVRQRYEQAVDIAKRQRKERKRSMSAKQPQINRSYQWTTETIAMEEDEQISPIAVSQVEETTDIEHKVDLNQIIFALRTLKKEMDETNRSEKNAAKLQSENDYLQKENENMQKEMKQLEKKLETVQADYQAFLQIMDRARKMVVFQDQDDQTTPAFRMEKNGNLEQLAR